MEQVMRVERMRQAILQDVPLDLVFAKPPLPLMGQAPGMPGGGGGFMHHPGGCGPPGMRGGGGGAMGPGPHHQQG